MEFNAYTGMFTFSLFNTNKAANYVFAFTELPFHTHIYFPWYLLYLVPEILNIALPRLDGRVDSTFHHVFLYF